MYKKLDPLSTETENLVPDTSNDLNLLPHISIQYPNNEILFIKPPTNKKNVDFTALNYKTPTKAIHKPSLSEFKPFQMSTKTPIKAVYSGKTSKNIQINKFVFADTSNGFKSPQTNILFAVQKLELPTPQVRSEARLRPSTAATQNPKIKINASTNVFKEKIASDQMQIRAQEENIDYPILVSNHGESQPSDHSVIRKTEKNISFRSASEPKALISERNSSFQTENISREQTKARLMTPDSVQKAPVILRKSSKFDLPNESLRRNSTNDDLFLKLAHLDVILNTNLQNQGKISFISRSSSVSGHIQSFMTPNPKKPYERKLFSASGPKPLKNHQIEESKDHKDAKSEKSGRSQSLVQINLIPPEELPSKKNVRISVADSIIDHLEKPERISFGLSDIKTSNSSLRPSLALSRKSSSSPRHYNRISQYRVGSKRLSTTKKNKAAKGAVKTTKPASTLEDLFSGYQVLLVDNDLKVKQTDLENENEIKKSVEIDWATYKDYSEGIETLEERLQYLIQEDQRFSAAKRADEDNFLKVNEMRLTELEIRSLKAEITKKQENLDLVDWEKIDSLIMRVKFFAKLPKPIRMLLLRYSEYYYYPRGSYVFKQGDYGDLMYVILRGSCNVRISRITPYGTPEDVVVNCLYDGDRFGELAMMGTTAKAGLANKTDHVSGLTNHGKSLQQQNWKRDSQIQISSSINQSSNQAKRKNQTFGEGEKEEEQLGVKETQKSSTEQNASEPQPTKQEKPANYYERTKRAASIQIAESADLLAISRDRFKEILLTMIQKELDVKLKALMCLPFFHKIEPFSLIPLANNLTVKKFKFGEVILRQGEIPQEFCIVSQGIVKIFKEVIDSRVLQPSSYAKARIPALKNFTHATRNEHPFTASRYYFFVM